MVDITRAFPPPGAEQVTWQCGGESEEGGSGFFGGFLDETVIELHPGETNGGCLFNSIIMEAKCHQDTYPHTLNHVNYYYFCGNAGKYVASDIKDLGDHNYRVALTIEVREGSHSEIIKRSLRDHLEIT